MENIDELFARLADAGAVGLALGVNEQSKQIFAAIKGFEPGTPIAHVGEALTAQAEGDTREAISVLEKTVEEAGDSANADRLKSFLALLLKTEGQNARADQLKEAVIAANRDEEAVAMVSDFK